MTAHVLRDPQRDRVANPEMNQSAQSMFDKKAAVPGTEILLGVGVIVLNETGWILLEKRKDCGLWGLPGGRIEPGDQFGTIHT